ncbi:MAG TPA: hypothetical protein PKC14_04600 [Candidatus Absconditabacterales bacterium]|nr:hypothetical protein [Candidatus Absconditabacterales bacterium]
MVSINPAQSVDNSFQNYRLVAIKYRIYSAVLLVGLYFLWTYIDAILPEYEALNVTAATADETLMNLDKEISQARLDDSMVTSLSGKTADILTVVNSQTGCSILPKNISTNLNTIKSYMLLSDLESEKMKYDEKKILANINEFLLNDGRGGKYADITSISIGEKKQDKAKNNFIPITILMSVDYRGLSQILDAVENKINPDFPILYTIESINYDLVNDQQTQDVTMVLNAYYYK